MEEKNYIVIAMYKPGGGYLKYQEDQSLKYMIV